MANKKRILIIKDKANVKNKSNILNKEKNRNKANIKGKSKFNIKGLTYVKDFILAKPWLRWTIIILVIIIIGLLLLSHLLRFSLYIYQLLGNDLLLDLEVNNRTYYLSNGGQAEIEINSIITLNPFCKSSCYVELRDLSEGELIWSVNSTKFSFSNNLLLRAPETGEGVKVYRVMLSCMSESSFLCHTSDIPTERFVLITLNYNASNEQLFNRQIIADNIVSIHNTLNKMFLLEQAFDDLSIKLKRTGSSISRINSSLKSYNSSLVSLEKDWDNFNYDNYNQSKLLYSKVNASYNNLYEDYNLAVDTIFRYNNIIEKLGNIDLESVRDIASLTGSLDEINNLAIVIDSITSDITLDNKENAVSLILKKTNDNLHILNETLINLSVKIDLFDLSYCNLSFSCFNTTPLVYQPLKDTDFICNELLRINNLESKDLYFNTSYNISAAAILLSQNSSDEYIKSLWSISDNDDLLITTCNENVIELNIPDKITFFNISEPLSYTLEQPKRQCCLNNSCYDCCPTCNKEELYPVIFIHGHSFTKSISAEYSLNSFTSIQKRLENDGFVNAGSITLYSLAEEGIWSELNFPLTLKLSYYYDTYYQPDNILLVQTKSENIDTYSLRINDLINDVLLRTNNEKVIIVAHSMGGLVVRRYLDVFGKDKVDKLILIAVPNQGISEKLASRCKWTGNSKECSDMSFDSIFMSKLNNRNNIGIDIVNIYGTGCKTEDYDGDGIVVAEILNNAQNYAIKGNCSGISFLHNDILDINMYPEVYNIMRNVLVGNNS